MGFSAARTGVKPMERKPAVGRTAIDFILVGRVLPPHEYRLWFLGIYRRLGQLGCVGLHGCMGIDCRVGQLGRVAAG